MVPTMQRSPSPSATPRARRSPVRRSRSPSPERRAGRGPPDRRLDSDDRHPGEGPARGAAVGWGICGGRQRRRDARSPDRDRAVPARIPGVLRPRDLRPVPGPVGCKAPVAVLRGRHRAARLRRQRTEPGPIGRRPPTTWPEQPEPRRGTINDERRAHASPCGSTGKRPEFQPCWTAALPNSRGPEHWPREVDFRFLRQVREPPSPAPHSASTPGVPS